MYRVGENTSNPEAKERELQFLCYSNSLQSQMLAKISKACYSITLRSEGGIKAFHFKSRKSYIHNILLHLIETILQVKAAIEFLQQLLTESSLYSIYIFLP